MRTIDALLTAEQMKAKYTPKYYVVLSKTGEDSVTLTGTDITRLVSKEEPWRQSLELAINNSSKAYTGVDYGGWTATPYFGALCGGTAYYSAAAPLLILNNIETSTPGTLYNTYKARGIFDQWADDVANDSYFPDDESTDTVKDFLTAIAGATMACYDHCQAVSIVFDSEDALIDTYMPKTGFRIYKNGSRLAAFKRLLEYTGCMARAEEDGAIHIFVPTTTGTSYHMEFKTDDASYPNVPIKATQTNVVIPNYIVVQSKPEDDPQYSGYATMGYALPAQKRVYYDTYKLESNAQATSIAAALLERVRMNAQSGYYNGLMNTNLEVFDYIKLNDTRAGDTKVGNIGSITRTIEPDKGNYNIEFSFGGWFSMRYTLKDLEIFNNQQWDYSSLRVENLKVGQLDIVWIDPAGNIDLSECGDTLDNLPDGSVYARVKAVHLDEGGLKIDDQVIYAAGYDPSTKRRVFTATPTTPYDIGDMWYQAGTAKRCSTARATGAYNAADWTALTQDDIANGVTYAKVLSTDLTAGHLKLTSATTYAGKWYEASGVVIDADTGILIYGVAGKLGLVTRASVGGADQCYVGSDGAIYAGGGAVKLHSGGLEIWGQELWFKIGDGTNKGYILGETNDLLISGATSSMPVKLQSPTGSIQINSAILRGVTARVTDLGNDSIPFRYICGTLVLTAVSPSVPAATGSLLWISPSTLAVWTGSVWKYWYADA